MAEIPALSPSTSRSDTTSGSTKSLESLRPHYYTTFQSQCCETKVESTTVTANKDLLPIPKKLKTEAEDMLNHIHGVLIENLSAMTSYTSLIPKAFLDVDDQYHMQRYLIDRVMLKTMNDAHIINWNSSLKQLYPIRTSGNGNCLLHAVLIAMVGIHDSNLYLRDRLAQFMDENRDLLKNHWRIERLKSDKSYGIRSEDAKLNEEWDEVCHLVHYEKSNDGQTARYLHFLEAVHIFAISNMLRRPIIILAEDVIRNKNGEAISVNDLFGIYLPILCAPRDCIREPIVLVYDHSHFCPLQMSGNDVEQSTENLLPLYQSINHTQDKTLLPIRFLGDDVSRDRSDTLLREYLQIRKIQYDFDAKSTPITIQCVELGRKHLLPRNNFFLLYHKYLLDFFETQKPAVLAEEERKHQRQCDADNQLTGQTSNDISGWSLIRQQTPRNALSTAESSRSGASAEDSKARHQPKKSSGHRYLYDDDRGEEGFVPKSGLIHIEKPHIKPQPSSKPPDPAKSAQRDIRASYSEANPVKQPSTKIYLDNISNPKAVVRFVHEQSDSSNPKSERPRVETPVTRVQPTVSTSSRKSASSERHVDPPVHCLVCNRAFSNKSGSAIYCRECQNKVQYAGDGRVHSANVHSPVYPNALTPVAKMPAGRRTICPNCKNVNMWIGPASNGGYHCSVCQAALGAAYRY